MVHHISCQLSVVTTLHLYRIGQYGIESRRITGCAVAQHCCNDDQQSQWENGDTPCRSETPENFITKIGHIDYVAGGNTHAKFYGNRPRSVRRTNSQNITSCDFVYLPFPSLPFPSLSYPSLFFLSSPTAKTDGRISSINMSNYAFSAKDVPFGSEKI